MTDMTPEETQAAALIAALREEIVEEHDLDVTDPEVPGLQALLRQVLPTPSVGFTVDELLVDDDVVDEELHERLVGVIRPELLARGRRPRYLEQIVVAQRTARALTVEQIAERLDEPVQLVSDIEASVTSFFVLKEEKVAAWIEQLELDIDSAVVALEASLRRPAVAYKGTERRGGSRSAREFSQRVRDLLKAAPSAGNDS
ncbi:MAG: hypothetical protein KY439_00125 [Actinobacteria bacterium]|nr:hypothetical protein [Actinomycetota bacterium]